MNVAQSILKRLLPALVVLVTMLTGMSFAEEARYSVSGTVNYGGGNTGRVYISAIGSNNTAYGVSIGSPGSFTIKGLPKGYYKLQAFIDTTGTGQRHAFDPVGKLEQNIYVENSDINASALSLVDQAVGDPVSPGSVRVIPVAGGALVEWDTPRNQFGQISVESFNVYWSTTPEPGPNNTVDGGKRLGLVAGDDSFLIIPGLTNGVSYYFAVSSTYNNIESPASPHVKVTINAPVGGNAISGTVSFGNPVPQGGLYLAAQQGDHGPMYLTAVTTPVSPQPFTIPAVPDGTYKIYGFLDMNGNGVMDLGDVTIGDEAAPEITVAGAPVSDVVIAMAAKNFRAWLRTSHSKWPGGESYGIDIEAEQETKLPVGFQLVNVPAVDNVPTVVTPIDIGLNEWGQFRASFPVNLRPEIGQVYTIRAFYADGTSEDKDLAVTGVVDGFATPVSPVGAASYQPVPTFTWQAPQQAPEKFSYSLWMNGQMQNSFFGWGTDDDRLPSDQTSVVYNFNGSAPFPELSNNGQYNWTISVVDAKGNASFNNATFTYGYGSITGHVKNEAGEPLKGIQVSASSNQGNPIPNMQWVSTDDNGAYTLSLPPGEYKVHFHVYSGGYFSEWYDNAQDADSAMPVTVTANTVYEGVDAVLSRQDFAVSGTVFGTNDTHLPGVKVWLHTADGGETGFFGYTDQNGFYQIPNVPAGEYKLFFDATPESGCTDSWLKNQDGQTKLVSVNEGSNGINVHLNCQQTEPAVTTVSGRVFSSATNAGIGNVTAKLYDLNGNPVTMMYTNPDGLFTLSYVKPGTYNLHFETVKLNGACEGEWYKDAASAVNGVQIVVGADPVTLDNATITCQPVQQQSNTFTGVVGNTATGLGQGGVKVSVVNAATGVFTNLFTTTNQDGWYQIPNVPDGSYYLEFSSTGCQTKWFENGTTIDGAVPVQVGGGTTLQNDTFITCGNINQNTIRFTGKVNDGTNPLAGVAVQVVGKSELHATTAQDGSFTVQGIPANEEYVLKMTAQGFAPSYTANLNNDRDVDVTARPFTMFTDQQVASWGGIPGKGVLRGVVVGETNLQNIPGAYVTAVKADDIAVTYPVFYFDGQKWVSDTSTYGNGMFMVLNVDDNVRVNTWAGKEGWVFYGRTFTGHAGAVSNGRLVGTQETSPYIKAKPPYLSFDSVPVGQDSNPQTITITNLGLQPLTIETFILNGDDGFAATGGGSNPCNVPLTLQSNASCTLGATFTATSEGPKTATLTAVSNASNGQDFQISLTGYGSVIHTDPLGVSYTFPADMTEGIAVNGPIFVGFSGSVDPSTITAQTFSIATAAGTAVAGKVSVDDEGAVFIPTAPLAPLTNYTATLTTGIIDTTGTPLPETYTWTFRTGQAVPTSFFTSLKGSGIFSVSDEESSEISVERTREGENGSLTETKFTFSDTGAWQAGEGSEKAWYLTTNGWQLHGDGAAAGTLVTNTDGTGTWTNKYDGATQKIEIADYDLSGQPFSGYMSPYSWAYDEQKTFPEGAKGYGMKMTPLVDTYRVYVWDEGSQGDENWVRYWPNGTEVAVTSLEQLLSVFANTQGNTQTLWFGNGLGARFDAGTTSGNLQLFLSNYDTGSQELAPVQTKGTWQIKDIKGQKLLQLTIPAAQQALLYDGIEPFFAVVDGKVKQGEFEKAGKSRFERRMSFNKIGFEALLGDRPPLEASFTLSVSIADEMKAGGNVTSNPDGISCGTGEACSSSFPAGQNVVLNAKVVTGWTFDGWTDCPSASGATCTVALNADKTVGAKFRKNDITPPNTTITKGPDKITGKLEATFNFTATEASTFQCKLDDGEWEPCLEGAPAATTGTKTYSDLYDGEHIFQVKATDQASNEDPSAAVFTWTIDTAVPAIDVMDGNGEIPVALSNLKTPSFTVLGDGLVKYKYKLDNGQYSALRDISAKITLATLADGDHILYVIGVNAAGTESDELSLEWAVDTIAPVTQLTEKPAALSNLRSPSFIFSAADAFTYECKVDKGVWEECYEEYMPADELLDGKHTFVVRAIDEAGNIEKPGAAQSVTWTVDATPPVAAIKSKPTKPVTGTGATIVVTGKDVVAYKYFVDGVESENEIPVKTPLVLTGLSDGTHTIEISGRDAAGNWQEENLPVAEVTVDNEAPVAEALSGVPAELTNAKKATIYVGGDGVVAYQYSVDGGAWVGGTKGIAVTKPISLTLKTKAYTLKVVGVDAAGNWQKDQVATYTWTSDVTVPKVVLTKPVSSTVLQAANTTLGFAAQLPEPNGLEFTCKVDTEVTYSACESPFALGELAPGAHTVSVIATDGAGNVSKAVAYKWTVKAAPVQ